MPQPMEDELEICQNGDKGRLWLTLLNEAWQTAGAFLSACLDLDQCDSERGKITEEEMNEERLCAGKKQNFYVSYTFPKYSLFCLTHSPSLL